MLPTRRLMLASLALAFAGLPASAMAAVDLNLEQAEVLPAASGATINDGIYGPGDTIQLNTIFSAVQRWDGGNGQLSVPSALPVTLNPYVQGFIPADPGNGTRNANPFGVKLENTYTCGLPVPLTLSLDGPSGHGEFAIKIPTGAAGAAHHYSSTDIGDPISDSETIESGMVVTENGKVKSINVDIEKLSHVYSLRWYEVTLVSPGPAFKRVKLFSRTADDSQKVMENVVFSDDAAMAVNDPSITQFKDLTVRPFEPLSAFDGEDAAGRWTLEVRDVHEAGSPRSGTRGRASGREGGPLNVGQFDAWSMDVGNAVCARTPVAWFGPDPLVVPPTGGGVLNGSPSVDPGKNNAGTAPGAITKYEWDLNGDGVFETDGGATPTLTLSAMNRGKRDVSLRVTDTDGNTSTQLRPVLVTLPPTVSAVTTAPVSPDANVPTTLTAAADAPGGSVASVEWDFTGDGVFEVTGASLSTTHTFTRSGPHVVRVKIVNDLGATVVKAFIVNVANQPPIAALASSATPGIVGRALTLSAAASTDPDGDIVAYEWDLDGQSGFETTTGAANSIEHTFTEGGTHDVQVRVTDNSGLTDTQILSLVVTAAPVARITMSKSNPAPGEMVTFDGGTSADENPGGGIKKYEWDLDGIPGFEIVGTSPTAQKAYPNAGSIQVRLQVTNLSNATGQISSTVAVTPVAAGGGGGGTTATPTPKPTVTPAPGPGTPIPNVPGLPQLPPNSPPTKGADPSLVGDGTNPFIGDVEPPDTGVSAGGFQAKLSMGSKAKAKTALKKGVAVKVTANATGTLILKGMVTAKVAKSIGLKPKGNQLMAVASGKVAITKAGTFKFIVKVPKKYQRYVKKAKKLPVSFRAVVTSADGEQLLLAKTVTIVK